MFTTVIGKKETEPTMDCFDLTPPLDHHCGILETDLDPI